MAAKAPDSRKEVVVSQHAFQMAKGWLQKMTGGADFDPENDDVVDVPHPESRPMRLGLGAKFIPHAQAATTSSPVMKNLRKQMDKSRRAEEKEEPPTHSDDGHDEEDDSRTNAFHVKKKNSVETPHNLLPRKKNKKKKKKQKLVQHNKVFIVD